LSEYFRIDLNVCHDEAMGQADGDALTNKLIISGHDRLGVSLKG